MQSPADAWDCWQLFAPERRWDDIKGLGLGFNILLTWQHIVVSGGFWVDGVRLAAVGGADDLGGHRAGLGRVEAVDDLRPIVDAPADAQLLVVVNAVGGGATGARPAHQPRVAVHVIGALALGGGGAGAGAGGGGARAACAVLRQAGARGGAGGGARGAAAGLDALEARAQVAGGLAVAGRHAGRGPGRVALRVPAGGGVAAGGAQAGRLAVRQAVLARHRQGLPRAGVEELALQRVAAEAVVLAGRSDLDAGTEGWCARRAALLQEAFGPEDLVVGQALWIGLAIGWAAGLKAKPRAVLQGVG